MAKGGGGGGGEAIAQLQLHNWMLVTQLDTGLLKRLSRCKNYKATQFHNPFSLKAIQIVQWARDKATLHTLT